MDSNAFAVAKDGEALTAFERMKKTRRKGTRQQPEAARFINRFRRGRAVTEPGRTPYP